MASATLFVLTMSGRSSGELVVGIDFGTTYSGFSWAVSTGQQQINVVTDWEMSSEDFSPTSKKVRTWIAYQGSRPTAHGFEAYQKPLKWFKILLQEDSYVSATDYVHEAKNKLKSIGKTVDQVIEDYLRWIWQRGLKDIKAFQGENVLSVYKVKVILTVPAAWKPITKDRTLQAAQRAGIPGTIELVAEPEAAALATLKDKNDNDELAVGDNIIICDAGGGTVDLISYQVDSIQPLKLKECAVGEGGLCGSVFLDVGFEELIKRKIGDAKFDRIRERAKRKLMQQFEFRIKRNFDGDIKRDFTVEIDGLGALGGDADSDDEDEDIMLIKGSEVLGIFDKVCLRIDKLVENQVKQIVARGEKVKAVFLVGGFGDSSYLHARLDRIYRSRGIQVLKSKEAWSAVCRGATSWGLSNKAIISRVARYSYGFPAREKFDADVHDYRDRVYDESEAIWKAQNQMQYLIRIKDDLKVGAVLTHRIYNIIRESTLRDNLTYSFTKELYYCDALRPPRRKEDNIVPFCEVEFELETSKLLAHSTPRVSTDNGLRYRDIYFSMEIELAQTQLTFSVKFAGETVAKCRAKLKEDFDT